MYTAALHTHISHILRKLRKYIFTHRTSLSSDYNETSRTFWNRLSPIITKYILTFNYNCLPRYKNIAISLCFTCSVTICYQQQTFRVGHLKQLLWTSSIIEHTQISSRSTLHVLIPRCRNDISSILFCGLLDLTEAE